VHTIAPWVWAEGAVPELARRNLSVIEKHLLAALPGMTVVPHESIEMVVPRQVLLTIGGNGHRFILSVASTLLAFEDPRAVVRVLQAQRIAERLLDGEPYLIVREDSAEPFDPTA
jgi:hypothetical protein